MLKPYDRLRVATHGYMCERTVRRVYKGEGSDHSRMRVAEVARQLGLPEPPLAKCSASSPSSSPTGSQSA